ncbi:hypothetical protein DTO164E3_3974 [Paecilomyces variotii]|nr:hypothetical protein DTO164E3_3974 [Paecilomyces variotii]KAJ9252947.1 hypothetical protein DTO207G8_4467 [Paecilomyces variotii]KAJ9326286.1 hypothetical protein DTO027B3_2600 [Paecilomyces variotii]KAJ9330306.1 hypothetical protein DTO027B5_7943 [Paecilomyces variotii]KAJ9406559.1 hypothetical protein DTO045G8_5730 [Paecilomyces variotii]
MALFLGQHQTENENFGVDWVIHYEFDGVGTQQAIEEFKTLINDLDAVGLQMEVRHGTGASLLVFVKVPRELLGAEMYKSRVKDWLYGISHAFPDDDAHALVEGETEAEELRAIYHLVTWQKEQGGAGIIANLGKWSNVKASFPLHSKSTNDELLRRWSKATILRAEDFDEIRSLFGEKVAYYFAFIQCYSIFLVFPAVSGFICWAFLGPYSITFAALTCLWSLVFVEYWKLKEKDLSIRWGVKGVGALKVNREQYQWDREVLDPVTGEIRREFSTRKQILRQLLQLPFAVLASTVLGVLIVLTFAMEVFLSEVYQGPFKIYLDLLPTVILSLLSPTITNFLTDLGTRLTDYENYRTSDQYERALTQKTFVLNFITSFLPIFLTAFIYVPYGAKIVPYLDVFRVKAARSSFLWGGSVTEQHYPDLHVDPARLQQEIIYLTVTAQVLSFGEEMVIPYIKRLFWRMYREYKNRKLENNARRRPRSQTLDLLLNDMPEESQFLKTVRHQCDAELYDVQEDILEMCLQFGYLVLFGAAWPLVPLGFLINNWIELRGDFLKISLECQRPPPIRADSIGPWLQVLEFLTWLGGLSSAAIVHLYRSDIQTVKLSSLLLTLFVTEQAFLLAKFLVRTILQKIGAETLRREEQYWYSIRKRYLETFSDEAAKLSRARRNSRIPPGSVEGMNPAFTGEKPNFVTLEDEFVPKFTRTNSGRLQISEQATRFWSWQKTSQQTIDAGVKLIQMLSVAGQSKNAAAKKSQ